MNRPWCAASVIATENIIRVFGGSENKKIFKSYESYDTVKDMYAGMLSIDRILLRFL